MKDETTPEQLGRIGHYVMPETPLFSSDLALLFGTRHGVDRFCDEAYSLWQRGLFKHLIISGGMTMGHIVDEASLIGEELLKRGIPKDIILLENAAMNTGEN